MAKERGSIVDANTLIETQLDEDLESIEGLLEMDCLVYVGPIEFGIDDHIRNILESRTTKRPGVAVILETTGGYIETAQRIADTIRHHYERVEFVVPSFAMSAGTVLVMSGDAIRMDYYSVLGPIDPQVRRPDGNGMIPASGYLVQYERLIEKSKKGTMTNAEAAFLMEKFDPAELYHFERACELSTVLLREWLVKYKFSDWHSTETSKTNVTDEMRRERAEKVAKKLGDISLWHSHSRGIPMRVLREEVELKIEDFGENPDLRKAIRSYHTLQGDYMAKRGLNGIIHIPGQCVPLGGGG